MYIPNTHTFRAITPFEKKFISINCAPSQINGADVYVLSLKVDEMTDEGLIEKEYYAGWSNYFSETLDNPVNMADELIQVWPPAPNDEPAHVLYLRGQIMGQATK